jgi:hypothetical protein
MSSHFCVPMNKSKTKFSATRKVAQINRISLSRGSPLTFMMLSTSRSHAPKIHSCETKAHWALHKLNPIYKKTSKTKENFQINAQKINLYIKHRIKI